MVLSSSGLAWAPSCSSGSISGGQEQKVQDVLWPRLGNRTSPLQHSMGPRKSQGRPAGRGGEIGFTPQRDERQWLCPIFHLPRQEIHLTLSSRVPMPGLLSVSIGDDSPTGRE